MHKSGELERSAGSRGRVKLGDEALEGDVEVRIVLLGMGQHELDDFTVNACKATCD
jgi:hypothetical protein